MSARIVGAALAVAFCRQIPADAAQAQAPDRPNDPGARQSAQGREEDPKRAKPPRHLVVKVMGRVIERAEFDEMPFDDFVEWLRRTMKADVVVRWKILERAGVERDRPITIKRKNIKLRKLLKLVYAQLTEDLERVRVADAAKGYKLIISTRKDIHTKLVVRTYDLRDLLLAVPQFAGGEFLHVDQRRCIALGTGRSTSDGGKRGEDPAKRLVRLITQAIQPQSWKIHGGRGTIVHFKGRLVVRNNVEVHRELAGMLGSQDDPERR